MIWVFGTALTVLVILVGIGVYASPVEDQREPKEPKLKRRLVRGVDPDEVNSVIKDLEDDNFQVLSVSPFFTLVDSIMVTTYDILVEGEGSPMWGSWGEDLG